MSKVMGFVIGAVEIGIGIATGNPALIVQGGLTIFAQAVVDLTASKSPARDASEMTIALGEQPRVAQLGETFTPGSLVDAFDYGGKYGTDWEVLVIRLADHKCDSLSYFYVNDQRVTYTGDGAVAGYSGQLEIYFRADTTTDPLPAIVTAHGPGWTADDIGRSGCDVFIAYKADKQNAKHPVWPGGRPHFGFVIKGKLHYDARKDSTVTGGSGPHRWTDPTTWEWSENAIICRYNWARGIYADDDVTDPTKLLVGRGLTAEEAPPENVIAAANLCDEVQGTVYPYQDLVSPLGIAGGNFTFSPDGTILAFWNTNGGLIEWWNVATRTRLGDSPNAGAMSGTLSEISVDANGTAWFMADFLEAFGVVATNLVSVPVAGSATQQSTTAANRALSVTRALTNVYTAYSTRAGYVAGTVHISIADSARDFCIDAAGDEWMASQPTTASSSFTLTNLTTTASHAFTGTARGGPSDMRFCYTAWNTFFVYTDGHFYIIDATTMTVTASGVAAYGSPPLSQQVADGTSFWVGFSEYSLQDSSLIRTIVGSNWVAGSYAETAFDPINDAIWAGVGGGGSTTLRVLFLDRHGGYRVAGPIYSNQEFLDVEGMFAAATAGSIVTRQGSVEVEPGQAKSVVATITDDDLVPGTKVSWNEGILSQSSDEWVNTVVPNYIEPDQNWNPHDAPVVRVTADIVADGKPREQKLTLRLVRYQAQALRCAEVARRMGRLPGRCSITLPPRLCHLEDGDWIQWTSNLCFGGGSKTLRIDTYDVDKTWRNTVSLREITGEAFAADGAFSRDLALPTTTLPPPAVGSPDAGNWSAAATTLTSSGASVPAIEITGSAADDDKAQSIVIEYWKSDGVTDPVADPDAIPWTTEGRYSPDTAKVDITSVIGGGTYYTAVSYTVDGIPGDRLVLGPETVGDLDVSGQALLKANNLSDLASAGTARTNLGLGSAALATLDIDGTMAANSDTAVASQKAVRTYVASKLVGMFDLRGTTDCSANPNYPAATKGDAYVVTVPGKIGGVAGTVVGAGDVYFATADNAGGTQAAVGASWDQVIHSGSLTGALLAANNLSDVASAPAARTNLGATTVGSNLFTFANPGAITFLRVNADNSVSALSAAAFRAAIGAGTGGGDLVSTNNLSDLTNTVTARANLGLLRLISFFFTTTPSASEVLGIYKAVDAFTLAANLAGSQVSVGTNPAATFAIDVQQAGVSIATISISTGGVVTLTTTSGTAKAIAVGDILKFVAPSSADTTIANVAVNLKGAL